MPSDNEQNDRKEASTAASVDILSYLSHATLDVIGEAGFNYKFNSLRDHDLPPDHPDTNILSNALARIVRTTGGYPLVQLFKAEIPILRYVLNFDERSRDNAYASKIFRDVGGKIIQAERKRIKEEAEAGERVGDERKSIKMGSKPKDLLSVILRTSVGEDGETVSDEDALNQIPTFILAGEYPCHRRTCSRYSIQVCIRSVGIDIDLLE
jgi:cytochrome P450